MFHRNSLSLLLGLCLSAGTLYIVFRTVPLSSIIRYFRAIDPLSVATAMFFVMMSLLVKALRWKVILSPYAQLPFAQAYHPLTIGLTVNCLVPGRAGELVRPLWHKARKEASFSSCAASLAAERCFDLLALLALLAATLWIIDWDSAIAISYDKIELSGALLRKLAQGLFLFCVLLLAAILLLATPSVSRALKSLLLRMPDLIAKRSPHVRTLLERKICRPLAGIVDRVAEGLSIMHRPWGALACIALSFAAWLLWAAGYYILVLGSPSVTLSFLEATASMVIVCLFIALPSVPGYWGLWEAGGVFSLSLFGVSAQSAAGITLANHAVQILPVCLAGIISMGVTGFRFNRLRQSKQLIDSPKAG